MGTGVGVEVGLGVEVAVGMGVGVTVGVAITVGVCVGVVVTAGVGSNVGVDVGMTARSRPLAQAAPIVASKVRRPRMRHHLKSASFYPDEEFLLQTRHLIHSMTRSAIMMVVALVLARMTLGITDASTTRKPSMPYTRQYWSITAIESEDRPILHVPETW